MKDRIILLFGKQPSYNTPAVCAVLCSDQAYWIIYYSMRCYAHTLYAIFCFEDWRAEARKTSFGQVSSKRRPRSTDGKEKFYEDLKRSAGEKVQASTSNATAAGNELGFKDYVPAGQTSNEERLRSVCASIKRNHRKRVQLYAILGVQLAYMKFYYISNRCDNCMLDNDPYVTITCLSCLKSNKNVKKISLRKR